MPTQKVFKRRVRARMTKTGESYTAARHQLLRKADPQIAPEPEAAESDSTDYPTSDDAVRARTGRAYGEWFELLDASGAADRRHTETARWLVSEHGVDGWWSQGITVAYERARGLRARHQMSGGFEIAATRTVSAEPEQIVAAFTDASIRQRWLGDAKLKQRPTTAANAARFDWSDPPSRLVLTVVPKGSGKAVVAVTHEKLPDADAAERMKAFWREWLVALKSMLEKPQC